MTERAGCWSITINNPTADDLNPTLPRGWVLEGQMEEGAEGTKHYQGMLTTPQCRFSAVKKVLPRAHIEVARNRAALKKYVHKEDTRTHEVGTVVSAIPNLFDYQGVVAKAFNLEWLQGKYKERLAAWTAARCAAAKPPDMDEMAMDYLDAIVAEHIRQGMRGVEYIAINPMWRSSWKKFWRSIIERNAQSPQDQEAPAQDAGAPPGATQPQRVCDDEGDAHIHHTGCEHSIP